MRVNLSPELVKVAKICGLYRQWTSRQIDLKSNVFAKDMSQTQIDMLGSIAEFAGAKLFNAPLTAIGSYRGEDIAGNIEVRAIRKPKNWYNLIVRPKDKWKFIVGIKVANLDDAGPYEIAGWYMLPMVRSEWLHEGGTADPFYVVPLNQLYPIESLFKLRKFYDLGIQQRDRTDKGNRKRLTPYRIECNTG